MACAKLSRWRGRRAVAVTHNRAAARAEGRDGKKGERSLHRDAARPLIDRPKRPKCELSPVRQRGALVAMCNLAVAEGPFSAKLTERVSGSGSDVDPITLTFIDAGQSAAESAWRHEGGASEVHSVGMAVGRVHYVP